MFVKYTPQVIRLTKSGKIKRLAPELYLAALKIGCKIYGKYLTKLPLHELPKMYGDFVCDLAGQPLPALPPPPYKGGKCPVAYHAFGTYMSKNEVTCNQEAYWRTSVALIGTEVESFVPILSPNYKLQIRLKNGDFADIRPMNKALWDSRNMGDTPGLSVSYYMFSYPCVNAANQEYGHSPNTKEVKRVDGLPDNCGDLPRQYPPDPDIDINDFKGKVTINNYNYEGDITETKELDFTIPIINIKPSFDFDFNLGGVDFNVNMGGLSIKGGDINASLGDIKNTLDVDLGDIKNTLDVDLGDIKNTLDVDLGDIKNTLDVDLGDIKNTLDVDLGDIKNTLDVDINADLNDIKNKLNTDIDIDLNDIKNKLDVDINTDLNDIKNKLDVEFEDIGDKVDNLNGICKFKKRPFNTTNYLPEDVEESEEGVEEEEKKRTDIEWVLLEITTFPPGGKTMLMEKQEDNTYFAGYFSWLIDTDSGKHRLEEIPIRKVKMAFKNPGDVQGYRFYTVNKAKIKSTIYYQPQTQSTE